VNWSTRYATTRKSRRELETVLPEGWEIQTTGQPDGEHWFAPQEWSKREGEEPTFGDPSPFARRNKVKTPDVHKLINRATGNTALIYDHSKMNEDTRRAYWNPIDHPESIRDTLSALDLLARDVSFRFTRHGEHIGNLFEDPGIMSANDSKNVNSSIPYAEENDTTNSMVLSQTLAHELGHTRAIRKPDELLKFTDMLVDRHNATARFEDRVDKKPILDHVSSTLAAHTGTDIDSMNDQYIAMKDNAPDSLKKVLQTNSISGYGESNLIEAHAEWHKNYILERYGMWERHKKFSPFSDALGKELKWDKPIQ